MIRIPHGPRAEASPDGVTILTAGDDGKVVLWERATGDRARELGTMAKPVMAVHWSADGRLIGAIDETGATRVWTRDGKLVREVATGSDGIDFAFSHDGRRLAIAARFPRIALFSLDGSSDREILPELPPRSLVYAASFSHDDKRVLVSGAGFVEVWDLVAQRAAIDLTSVTDMTAAWLSPDERLIYGGGVDRVLRVWDAETGSEITTQSTPSEIYGMAIDRDGSRVAAMTLGGALVWHTKSFVGDVSALRRLAACRTTDEVDAMALHKRKIDDATCNRLTR